MELVFFSWHHKQHEINCRRRKIYPPATAGGTDLTVPGDRRLNRVCTKQVHALVISECQYADQSTVRATRQLHRTEQFELFADDGGRAGSQRTQARHDAG